MNNKHRDETERADQLCSFCIRVWRNSPREICATRLIKVLMSAWDWFGSFMTLLPSLFPPPHSLPLGCFHMLMDGQLCGPTAWNSSPQRRNGDGRREERKGQTDRQRERPDKSGLMHIRGPNHRPKKGSLQEHKEPKGGFLFQCMFVYYARLVLLRAATNSYFSYWVICSLFSLTDQYLVHTMSESTEKNFSRVSKLLVLSNSESKTQRYSIYCRRRLSKYSHSRSWDQGMFWHFCRFSFCLLIYQQIVSALVLFSSCILLKHSLYSFISRWTQIWYHCQLNIFGFWLLAVSFMTNFWHFIEETIKATTNY